MTSLVLSELPYIVAARLRQALPDLATCKGMVGRLDLDEVQRGGYPAPAVLVSRMRLDGGTDLAGPHRVYRVTMAAFVLAKDTLGLPRDIAASNIAQVIIQLLPDCRWGRADIGPAERLAEEPIVTPAIRKAGVALTSIMWEQNITLETLPATDLIHPEVYVRASVGGAAAEAETIGGGA